MATWYIDPLNGDDANNGTSFALRKKTPNSLALTAGDTVKFMKSPDPTSIGSATWTNNTRTVTLAGALTANIDTGDSAWTGATGDITCTASTTRKEGSNSSSIAIAAGFTTGLIAYKALGAATDFSAYQQVSFWIRINATSLAAGVLELKLCSDTAGATPVDTLVIPAIAGNAKWAAITIDNAAALGSSIQSVALYAASDPGAITVLLDNIIACKASSAADSLTLTSLIGKNTTDEHWFPIAYINGTTVGLEYLESSLPTNGIRYPGTTETVTSYKRETFKTAMLTGSGSTNYVHTSGLGTATSLITISGGWDTTDMTTQTGHTFVCGQNGLGNGWVLSNYTYFLFERFGFYKYSLGFSFNTSAHTIMINDCWFGANSTSGAMSVSGENIRLTNVYACGGEFRGFECTGSMIIDNVYSDGSGGSGVELASGTFRGRKLISRTNNSYGIVNSTGLVEVQEYTSSNNSTGGVRSAGHNTTLHNCSISESTEVTMSTSNSDDSVFLHNLDGVAGNHKVVVDGGVIVSETGSDRRTLTGIAWKMSPTATRINAYRPLRLKLAKILTKANSEHTVKVWVKRDNTGITAKLVCRGGQVAGVSSDVTASASGSSGSYEQLTLTFTPTASDVIEIEAQVYGGTTFNAWYDDLEVSGA